MIRDLEVSQGKFPGCKFVIWVIRGSLHLQSVKSISEELFRALAFLATLTLVTNALNELSQNPKTSVYYFYHWQLMCLNSID